MEDLFAVPNARCIWSLAAERNLCRQMGLHNPDVNFLGIDLISDMLGVAQRNIRKLYQGKAA